MVCKLNGGEKSIINQFKDLSILTVSPALSKFPYVSLTTAVDIFSIFTFEPIHRLSLGVFCLLKLCAIDLLKKKHVILVQLLQIPENIDHFLL